ncbi:unnamed protein product [Urochloa humidicola]
MQQQFAPNVSMMHPSMNGPQVFPPAAPVQNDEVEVQEPSSAVPTGKGKSTKGGSRIKLRNFSPEEDVNLVTLYLEISEDAITNTGQKRERFWERVLQRYNFRRGSYPVRSWRSLQSRWELMKPEVSKFASYYSHVVRKNPSGMSDADKTTLAATNFAGVETHPFAYLHCWNIMKDSPNWQDPNNKSIGNSDGGDAFAPDTVNLDGNSSPPASAGKRPMCRDACKAAKKKANSSAGSASSSDYASRMQDLSLQKIAIMQEESVKKSDRFQLMASIDEKRFEEMCSHNQSLIECEQEKIRMMREKHDIELEEKAKLEEERILGIDLETCTAAQRVYYQFRQQQILAKIGASCSKGQGPAE